MFTKGTTKLKDKSQRLPSVSTKQHLPYFDDSEWIREFIAYKKLTKLESTYVGQRGGKLVPQRSRTKPPQYTQPKGVWKYLDHYNRLHSNLFLHRTNTGRTASANPNSQNWPKRGKMAKAFRKIMQATKGWGFVEADLSQAELRIAAWMANEPTMIAIYNAADGDIHAATASIIVGIDPVEFSMWRDSDSPIPEKFRDKGRPDVDTLGKLYDHRRFQAKAVLVVFTSAL